MVDIEKAKRLFLDSGLAFPTIPADLAVRLRELRPWLYSSRKIEMSPYNLQHYLHEIANSRVEDYVILAHSGHGINSYAIQYYVVRGALRMFLHLGWGGGYMDNETASVTVRDCFSLADQIVEAAETVREPQADEQLTIVGSDFYGSYWLRPGQRPPQDWPVHPHFLRKTPGNCPLKVLSVALRWLTLQRPEIQVRRN